MYLKPKEIEKYKKKLIDLRNQLTTSVQGTKEEVRDQAETKGYSQHQADEGTDEFGRTMNLNLTNKEILMIKQINRALKKIEEGTYGICDITGKEISKKRLDAIPYANMTIDAQENLEKKKIT
jgi:DnaK suppressor protein